MEIQNCKNCSVLISKMAAMAAILEFFKRHLLPKIVSLIEQKPFFFFFLYIFFFWNLNFYFVISRYKTPSGIWVISKGSPVLSYFVILPIYSYVHHTHIHIHSQTVWSLSYRKSKVKKKKKKKKIYIYVERPLQFFVVHLSHYQSHYNFMAGYRRKYSGFNKDFLSIAIRYFYTSISPYNDQPQRYKI